MTDGALSSDIFQRDYHHLAVTAVTAAGGPPDERATEHLLPVKWMAVETLQCADDERHLSTASDVVRDDCRYISTILIILIVTRHRASTSIVANISRSRYIAIATQLVHRLQIRPIVHN